MIINDKDLVKEIDRNFWRFITGGTPFSDVIHYKDIDRSQFLAKLAKNVNEYKHSFSNPDYYYMSKDNGVLRRIKVYSLEDSIIYYYCVKKIKNKLSEIIKLNKDTYKPYITNPHNDPESTNTIINAIDDTYSSAFNRKKFIVEWTEYQELAKDAYNKHYDLYLHIDIYHFYDDINLDILERNIRSVTPENIDLVSLLFHFLKYSDKHDLGYFPSTVGIPQEITAEMSRILANFYLTPFDSKIQKHLRDTFGEGNFHYFRYSDDMWICFNGDKYDTSTLVQWIGLELEKIKLHINERKTEYFSASEYYKYWRFDDWNAMSKTKENLPLTIYKYQNIMKYDKEGRWFSVASYLLKTFASNKNSITYFSDINEAKELIKLLISSPLLVEKLEPKHLNFFKKLIIKFPQLKTTLINYIQSKQNIYPSIEYFIFRSFSMIKNDKSVLTFFSDYYINNTSSPDYKWYTRCLCIKYFINNIDLLKKDKIALSSIVSHISQYTFARPKKEIRYELFLLSKIASAETLNLISKNYKESEDIQFIEFIKTI